MRKHETMKNLCKINELNLTSNNTSGVTTRPKDKHNYANKAVCFIKAHPKDNVRKTGLCVF